MLPKFVNSMFLVFWLFFAQNVLADATPFKNKLTIHLELINSKKDTIQKVCLLQTNTGKKLDTICSCDGPTCVWFENNTVKVTRHIPENFKLLLWMGGKQYTSPYLNCRGIQTQIELKITDTEIIETTPFFRVPLKDYLLALVLTLFFELLTATAFFIKHQIKFKNLRIVLYCNLLTHPILWLTCAYFIGWGFNLILAEIVVVFVEGLLLYRFVDSKISFSKSLKLSAMINAASYIFGGILYLILT